MSRSRKRTPVSANTCAESDKPFKAASHRQERAAVRVEFARDPEAVAVSPKAFGNPWKSAKDGKHWMGDQHPEYLRK